MDSLFRLSPDDWLDRALGKFKCSRAKPNPGKKYKKSRKKERQNKKKNRRK